MATVVQKGQTGAGAASELTGFASCKAGNLLVMFISQQSSTAAPSAAVDNTLSGLWTIDTAAGHHAIWQSSTHSLWLATKTAVGGETSFSAASALGTIQGLAVAEISGLGTVIDTIVKNDNTASSATTTSPSVTTADAGDVILGAVGAIASTGTITAWTGTGPMTNYSTAATRCMGGHYIPGSTLSGATFTANWTTGKQTGMLVVAFKPSEQTGKAAGSLSAGASLTPTSNRRALASGSLSAGARLSPTVAKIGVSQGELHVGARVSATAESVRLSAGVLRAGVNIATSANKRAQAGGEISAGPRISATAAKLAQAAGSVSVGPRLISSASKTAAASASVSVGVRLSSGALKIGQATVELHVGPRIAGLPAGRTGSGQGQLHLGVGLKATAQKVASATGQLSVAIRLSATSASKRVASGTLHVGARTSSTAGKRVQAAGSLTLGAQVSTAYASTRSSTSQLRVGVRLTGEGLRGTRVGVLRVGAQIQGTGEAVIIPPEPPVSTPFAAVVSVGRTGTLSNATGRVAANETGRPNR